jgi:hypothetical protein
MLNPSLAKMLRFLRSTRDLTPRNISGCRCQLFRESWSQKCSRASRCFASLPRNSKPCRSPSRYRTRARSLIPRTGFGMVRASHTTSPGSKRPVKVPPTPSTLISEDRPQKSMFFPSRNTVMSKRKSTGYRVYRRLIGVPGFPVRSVILVAIARFADSIINPCKTRWYPGEQVVTWR